MRSQVKFRMVRRLLLGSVAALFVGATQEAANAFPGLGANCAQCHTDSGGGTLQTDPNPITLLTGQSGSVTFDIADLAGGAALSITGLDAAGLGATVDNVPPWTSRDNGTRFTLGGIDAAGQRSIDLTVPAGATPGDYPISVFLAGSGSTPEGIWSTLGQFTISVSAIPEPATLTLVGILLGAVGLRFVRRCRRG
jgi:hypothetical protein